MKQISPKFTIDIVKTDSVKDVPGSWTSECYKQILEACEFDELEEVAEYELPDYAIIALLDYEPKEAATIVLKVKLGDKLKIGQIQNMAHEMQEENLWEEYSDLSLHEQLYHCSVLLYQIFPKSFPEPKAVKCILEIQSDDVHGKELLNRLDETLLVRLLGGGMDDHSILKRLFTEQLDKVPFSEAEHIVWQFETLPMVNGAVRVIVYSSLYWLKPLLEPFQYECTAFSDLERVKI